MKVKRIIYALMLFGLCSTVATTGVNAQIARELNETQNDGIDTLGMSYDDEAFRTQQSKEDEQNLSDLKSEKSDTREKAREAKRVEREAYEASRESSNAYRTEKKAQKARKQADKQAKKAARARKISNAN